MGWKISQGGGPGEPVEFSVLGPVRVQRAGEEVALGSPQERALLTLLLVRAGQPVAVRDRDRDVGCTSAAQCRERGPASCRLPAPPDGARPVRPGRRTMAGPPAHRPGTA